MKIKNPKNQFRKTDKATVVAFDVSSLEAIDLAVGAIAFEITDETSGETINVATVGVYAVGAAVVNG